MTGFIPLLKKEITEQLRTHRLLIVGGIFLFFGLTTPLMLKYMPQILEFAGTGGLDIEIPEPTAVDSLLEYIGTIGQLGALVAVLVTMGSIANELKSGTALMTLSKPVSRRAFIMAKLTAITGVFTVALAAASLVCYLYTMWLIGSSDVVGFIGQNLLTIVFFVFCIAITLLFSSLFKSSLAAGGLGMAVIISQAGLSAIPRIGDYFPGKILTWGGLLTTGGTDTYWGAFAVTAVATVLCLYFAGRILNRKDI